MKIINDFITVSAFQEFYDAHIPYYEELTRKYKQLVNINKMRDWLDNKFKESGYGYSHYRIVFSPLTGGAHATRQFSDNGFTQLMMFVSALEHPEGMNNYMAGMLAERVVFTEIDHNYINPISDKFKSRINTAFANKDIWVDKSKSIGFYLSSLSVFNEYMTWALFSLYCMDTYPKEEVLEYLKILENQMSESRGFTNFQAFNRELLFLYENIKDISLLYDKILLWCTDHQT